MYGYLDEAPLERVECYILLHEEQPINLVFSSSSSLNMISPTNSSLSQIQHLEVHHSPHWPMHGCPHPSTFWQGLSQGGSDWCPYTFHHINNFMPTLPLTRLCTRLIALLLASAVYNCHILLYKEDKLEYMKSTSWWTHFDWHWTCTWSFWHQEQLPEHLC